MKHRWEIGQHFITCATYYDFAYGGSMLGLVDDYGNLVDVIHVPMAKHYHFIEQSH